VLVQRFETALLRGAYGRFIGAWIIAGFFPAFVERNISLLCQKRS
jgi:hypothetical protein